MAKNELSALESLRARYSYLEKEDGELSALERLKKGYTYLIPEDERADYGPPELETAAPAPVERETSIAEFAQGVGLQGLRGTIGASEALASQGDLAARGLIPGYSALVPRTAAQKVIGDIYEPGKEAATELMPEAYRAELERDIVLTNENDEITGFQMPTGEQVVGTIAESAAYIPQLLAGGGAASSALQGVARKGMADFVGYGAANAATVAPTQGIETFRSVYEEARANGLNETEAYKAASEASQSVEKEVGALSFLTGGAGLALASRLGGAAATRLGGATKGFLADAPLEAIEEGGQAAITDFREGRDFNVGRTANAAALGAIAGGIPGAAVGFTSKTKAKPSIDQSVEETIEQLPDGPEKEGAQLAQEIAAQAEAEVQSMLGKSIYPKISKTLDFPKDAKSTEIDLGQVVEMSTDTLPSIKPVEDRAADVEVIDDLTGFSETPVRDTTARDAQLQELAVRRDYEQKVIAQQELNAANPQLSEGGRKRAQNKLIQAQGRLEKIKQLEAELTGFVPEKQTDTELTLNNAPVASTKAVAPLAPVAATPVPAVTPEAAVAPETSPESDLERQLTPEEDAELRSELDNDPEIGPILRELDTQYTSGTRTPDAPQLLKNLSPDIKRLYDKGTVRIVKEDDAKVVELIEKGSLSSDGRGFFDGKNIYIRADKVKPEEANAVALHEVKHFMDRKAGSVKKRSLKSILGDEGNVRVVSRIEQLAKSGNKVAQNALARANADDKAVRNDEMPAYFIEEAAIAAESGTIGRAGAVIRDIISAAKAKLADFGLDLNLSENDIYYLGRQLAKEAGRTTAKVDNKAKIEPTFESQSTPMFRFNEPGRNLRGKVGNSTISYAMNDKGEANLNLIRTPQEHRGKGEARKALKSFLREADNNRVPVTLTVAEQSADTDGSRLQEFYESEGFKVVGKARDGSPKMRREASVVLESKSKPAQPRDAKLTNIRADRAVSKVPSAPVPSSKSDAVTSLSEYIPGVDNFVGRKARKAYEKPSVKVMKDSLEMANVLRSAVAGVPIDVFQEMTSGKGHAAVLLVEVSQAANRLERLLARYPKQHQAQYIRLLQRANSSEKKVYQPARDLMKKMETDMNSPLFSAWQQQRTAIDRLSVELIRRKMNKRGPLTTKDAAQIKTIAANIGKYVHRSYVIHGPKKIAKQHQRTVMSAWEAWRSLTDDEKANVDKPIFENAKEYVKKNWLNISDLSRIEQTDPKQMDQEFMDRLQGLYEAWVDSTLRTDPPPARATPAQKEAYAARVISDLVQVRDRLGKNIDVALEERAIEATEQLLKAYKDGEAPKIVDVYRGALQDESILKKRDKIPPELRKLFGEIADPIIQLHQTQLELGNLLIRDAVLNNLYDIGKDRYFVDSSRPADGKFVRTLKSENLGPLQDVKAIPEFASAIEAMLAPAMGFDQLINSLKRVDTNNSLLSGMMFVSPALRGMNWVTRQWKFVQIVASVYNATADLTSVPFAILSDGYIPFANKEAREKALGAAYALIDSADRVEFNDAAREILRNYLHESGQVGEIQAADFEAAKKRLMKEFSVGKEEDLKIKVTGILGKGWESTMKGKRLVADAKAMSDAVGKFYVYFMEKEWVREVEKAKGNNPSEVQIEKITASRVDMTQISYHRAMPAGKITEALMVGTLMNYFTETGRTYFNKFRLARNDFKEASKHEGKVRELYNKRAWQRLGGAIHNTFTNQLALRSYQYALTMLAISAATMDDSDESEEEKKKRLQFLQDQTFTDTMVQSLPLSERGKTWITFHTADKRAFMYDVSRHEFSDPATAPIRSMLAGAFELATEGKTERFDQAWAEFSGLRFESPPISANMRVLFGSKKPALAKNDPEAYESFVDDIGHRKLADWLLVNQELATPAMARNARELASDTSRMSTMNGTMKLMAAAGWKPRIIDPSYDLPLGGAEFDRKVDKARRDVVDQMKFKTFEVERVRDAYLDGLDSVLEAQGELQRKVSAARSLEHDEDFIIKSLTTGVTADFRGGGISKEMAKKIVDQGIDGFIDYSYIRSKKKEQKKGVTDLAEIERINSQWDQAWAEIKKINESLGEKEDDQR